MLLGWSGHVVYVKKKVFFFTYHVRVITVGSLLYVRVIYQIRPSNKTGIMSVSNVVAIIRQRAVELSVKNTLIKSSALTRAGRGGYFAESRPGPVYRTGTGSCSAKTGTITFGGI